MYIANPSQATDDDRSWRHTTGDPPPETFAIHILLDADEAPPERFGCATEFDRRLAIGTVWR